MKNTPSPGTNSRELCEEGLVMVWYTGAFPGGLTTEVRAQVVFSTLLERGEGYPERSFQSRLCMGVTHGVFGSPKAQSGIQLGYFSSVTRLNMRARSYL